MVPPEKKGARLVLERRLLAIYEQGKVCASSIGDSIRNRPNAAATLLIAPVAVEAAQALHVSPIAFAMTVVI